jgi:transcriptional regulator with XRE-family HTH domain
VNQDARDNRQPHHDFALELERVRREAGLKPKELALELFVDPRTVRRYLNGERLPSLETTEAWERACNLEPGRLTRVHPDVVGSAPHPSLNSSAGRRRWVMPTVLAGLAASAAVLGLTFLGGATKSNVEQTVERAKQLTTTYPQRTGGPSRTWSDFTIAGGDPGPAIDPRQTVRVTCRIRGFKVQGGNDWWYLVASAPWRNNYFATADAFYNQRRTEGVDFRKTRFVDRGVPLCP